MCSYKPRRIDRRVLLLSGAGDAGDVKVTSNLASRADTFLVTTFPHRVLLSLTNAVITTPQRWFPVVCNDERDDDDDDGVGLHVLGCRFDRLGTNCSYNEREH